MNDAIDVLHQTAAAETAEKLCNPGEKLNDTFTKNRQLITTRSTHELTQINSMMLPDITKSREAAGIADIVKQIGSRVRDSGCSDPLIVHLFVFYKTLSTVDFSQPSK